MPKTSQAAPTTKRPHFATLLVMALAPKEVGSRIRQARKAKGWTHEQLARGMGVGLRTVQRWQDGEMPRLGTLMRLADVLEVPQSYFVESEDEQATLADLSLRVEALAARQDEILEAVKALRDGAAPARSREAEGKARPRRR
jgi:transcriptional regulator with XRE-family HTH domain